jgi:predicted GIY-YIG superfamily endonuclease
MGRSLDDLIAELNGCLGKTTSILSLVSNSRASEITKSISQTTIQLVTGISSALQQTNALSIMMEEQSKSNSDAIEAVKNLKRLVKMQKETIDSFHLHKASLKTTAVNTDPVVVPEKNCSTCDVLRKTVESLEGSVSSKSAEWRRKEEASCGRQGRWEMFF